MKILTNLNLTLWLNEDDLILTPTFNSNLVFLTIIVIYDDFNDLDIFANILRS